MSTPFAEFDAALRSGVETPPPSRGRAAAVFLASLAAFVACASFTSVGPSILAIVFALLFHELGHYLFMRLFGYRNLNMFFLPFFGAAVTGEKHAAPAWQQAVMLLAGPLPGLLLAIAISFALPREIVYHTSGEEPRLLTQTANLMGILLVLNGFNLLPIPPLDGGRLIQLIASGASPRVSIPFLAASNVALLALAVALRAWVLLAFAVVTLITLPAAMRREVAIAKARARWPSFPQDPAALRRREARLLARLVRRLNPEADSLEERVRAARKIHGELARPGLASLAAWLILAAYAGGWALVLIASARSTSVTVVSP